MTLTFKIINLRTIKEKVKIKKRRKNTSGGENKPQFSDPKTLRNIGIQGNFIQIGGHLSGL